MNRIVGYGVLGPGEKRTEETLKEFKRLTDTAVIACNGASERDKVLIKRYGFWHYDDDREWGLYQPQIKTDLLKKVTSQKPNWLLPMDFDEVFAPEFTRDEANKLMQTGEIAYHFLVVNLYNDKDHYVHGLGIQRFWNVRFYKYLPQLGLEFMKKRLHCGLAPPYAYKFGWHAPFYLEHYGLMTKEDRERKAQRYEKYDPDAKFKDKQYYESLRQDLKPITFRRERLLTQLKESKECQPRTLPQEICNMDLVGISH